MAHTIVCADNHATCEECFETYLINKTTDLGQTSMLAAKAEAAALAGDEGFVNPRFTGNANASAVSEESDRAHGTNGELLHLP